MHTWFLGTFFLLSLSLALAVTIQGTVYDFSLNPAQNAIVEINTTPHQTLVAKNATYHFTVPAGQYLLKARHNEAEAQENITALQDGKYTLDLILFPTLDIEETPELPNYETYLEEKNTSSIPFYFFLSAFVLIGIIAYLLLRKPKKDVEVHKEHLNLAPELREILAFLEQQGNRTTQKDIRRQFPHSEAKISLMLDELEAKGLVERIKKGRGNLIIKN